MTTKKTKIDIRKKQLEHVAESSLHTIRLHKSK